MNGEARPLKEDLSTFNIEIVQISKRIAPKSGLRWPAPHSPQTPRPALRGASSLSGWLPGALRLPSKQRKEPASLTPGAETWDPSPPRALGAASPLGASWGSRLHRTSIPPLSAVSPARALS